MIQKVRSRLAVITAKAEGTANMKKYVATSERMQDQIHSVEIHKLASTKHSRILTDR